MTAQGQNRCLHPRLRLTVAAILGWADAHQAAFGEWPTRRTGQIREVPRLTWANVNLALYRGFHGLPGGSSLARLLGEERGVRTRCRKRHLSVRQILVWADAHHEMHGRWPNKRAGNIEGQQGLTWATVNQALSQGLAGLPGGSSLSRLLGDETGVRTARHKRQLTELAIVVWADAFHARQGRWPTRRSGPVEGRPDLTWELIHTALRVGRHGLAGGSSLAELLRVQRRARRRKTELPPLDAGQILAWADAYHARHGRWPSIDSGPVDGVPRETWSTVAAALCFGLRGLPDGGSLVELLADHLTSPG